jgi:hypothetical protein
MTRALRLISVDWFYTCVRKCRRTESDCGLHFLCGRRGAWSNSSVEDVAVRAGYWICFSPIEIKNNEMSCLDCRDSVSLVG